MVVFISSNFKKHYKTNIDFIDHYWITFFENKRIKPIIIPNLKNICDYYIKKFSKVDLIILPGGNEIIKKDSLSKKRNLVEKNLIKLAKKKKIPVLGVCRGMQFLNIFFGGKIKKISGHMKTRHKIFIKNKFFLKKTMNVNSFHSFGIPKKIMSSKFDLIAEDKDLNVELFKHKKFNMYGTMWHPEREKNSKFFNKLIKKLLKK